MGCAQAKGPTSRVRARLPVLEGSPFADWRVSGILLAVLVGGGLPLTAERLRRHLRRARELSTCAGLGRIVFEVAELTWIGLQPLEIMLAGIGAAVATLAPRRRPSAAFSRRPREQCERDAKVIERTR